jgi:glycosyltransferase involved in cell wall biosynthesis
MQVVTVIDGLGFGGAERSLAELLPGLVEHEVQPTVACLRRRDGGVEGEVLAQGFDVRFLPRGPMERIAALRGVIRDVSADLVHTSLVESSLVGRWAAAGTRVPVLTSLVNQSYTAERRADPHVNRLAVGAVRQFDRWTARHLTTHFHAITHAVKRWAVAELRVPPERVTVVERGRDPHRLGEATPERKLAGRERLGVSRDADVILAVGRQEFQKGHRFLLEAMEPILRARPSTVLLLAGREGAETAHLRTLAKRSPISEAVRFLGFRDDLPDLLAASDLFVFPSLWEGLGGAVIEAMALGLPIVATDLEPVREVVEDGRCATLVPPRSPQSLASAIVSLLDDRDRARVLGGQGREIYLRRFTLQRSTERMVELCRQVTTVPPARATADGLGMV